MRRLPPPDGRFPGGRDFGTRVMEPAFRHHDGRIGRLLFLLVFCLLVAAVVYLLVQSRRTPALAAAPRPAGAYGAGDSALDILRTRYARGEIDRDEYVQRAADLGGPVSAPPAPPPPTPTP